MNLFDATTGAGTPLSVRVPRKEVDRLMTIFMENKEAYAKEWVLPDSRVSYLTDPENLYGFALLSLSQAKSAALGSLIDLDKERLEYVLAFNAATSFVKDGEKNDQV